MTKKISLVLEGGGMRGAYTAGCLSWLLDEGIEFDNAYGISTGAVHLTSFLLKRKDFLYDMSTYWIADKSIVGLRAFLRSFHIVDYDYLFRHIIDEELHYNIEDAHDIKTDAYIGVYDVDKGLTEYHHIKEMDNEMLKAATSLPIIGKKVVRDNHVYLDGGITEMIPVHPSVSDGCDAHLVITTKPAGYVRKPAKSIVVKFMSMFYPQCDHQIAKDYAIRHINYNRQISEIQELEKEGKAFYRYPSETIPVSRLSGDKENLRKLYELGRKDMEASREQIYALIKD